MTIECFSCASVPLGFGTYDVSVFRGAGVEHLVISKGDLSSREPPFLRIHSECFTGEVLGSLRCDCKEQLDSALMTIAKLGRGLVIYLRNHEGRGIGLGNKIKAYQLQENGHDTLSANHALGFPDDLRSFSEAVEILKSLGIPSVRLNTNNPRKIAELRDRGIAVVEAMPSLGSVNEFNRDYLWTKYQKLGHTLQDLFRKPAE